MVHTDKIEDCKAQINALIEDLEERVRNPEVVKNPEEVAALEKEIEHLTNRLRGLITGLHIQHALDSDELHEDARALAQDGANYLKNDGYANVNIIMAGGIIFSVIVSYYRGWGWDALKNGKKGCYPGLVLLGIHEGYTPLVASEVSMMPVILGSFKEAQKILKERGIKLSVNTIRNIAYRYSKRARLTQMAEAYDFPETVAGRRIAITIDGGKLRLRVNKPGPKTKKGRTRYHARWAEPRLFVIYEIGNEGRMNPKFAPFIDGNIDDLETLFDLLEHYLKKLNITEADQVVFLADGAHWIWNRTQKLIEKLGLDKDKVHQVLDFFHAVEHLGEVAKLRKSWSEKERKRWITRHRHLLLEGKADKVIQDIETLCHGRYSSNIRTHLEYFAKNHKHGRLRYADMKEMNLPMGSGAVESAIRRVINLRMKGPSIFWLEESVDAMIHLRSYYKAGRWELLSAMANSSLSVIDP